MQNFDASPLQSIQLFPDQARARLDQGAILIDVREPEEYAQARIPDSTLLPMSELQQRLGEIPRDQEVIIYCRSGNRSGQVVDFLRERLGYTNVYNLAGGIIAWYRRSLPVDTSPVEAAYRTVRYENVSVAEAQQRLSANSVTLVDVREPYEFTGGHLPGAVNIPLQTIPGRLAELQAAESLMLVCATGNRSAIAADWLMQQGLSKVANVEGGTVAWARHGLLLEM
ncbi:MAG: rhodanese-like domain-containing protein [Caldilineales bacterium]|nr:rhodanese-like domain-containing protein [Caldilineales bacterium]